MIDIYCTVIEGGTIDSTIAKGLEINLFGIGVPKGGTEGQVLVKIDNQDYNTKWTSVIDGGTF